MPVGFEVESAKSLSVPVILEEKQEQPRKERLLPIFGLLGALGVVALLLSLLYFSLQYLF